MATTQENAIFSAHIYSDANAPALPSGWVEAGQKSLPSGFYAEAYRNTTTGEIVITYRGTEPGDVGDIIADYGIATKQAGSQFNEALNFADNIAKSYPDAPISTTGHSLGGALAQYVSGVIQGEPHRGQVSIHHFFQPAEPHRGHEPHRGQVSIHHFFQPEGSGAARGVGTSTRLITRPCPAALETRPLWLLPS